MQGVLLYPVVPWGGAKFNRRNAASAGIATRSRSLSII